jgi:putative acetyltransferase
MSDAFAVTLAQAPDADIRALVGELDDELAVLTPDCGQRHGLDLDAIFQPHIRFFIARQREEAVACGGIALLRDYAEVKRMYVRPAWRGKGAADAIMRRLIAEATGAGISLLRLETGADFIPAGRFYRRWGFAPCAAFGDYLAMPPQAIAASAFLKRPLP